MGLVGGGTIGDNVYSCIYRGSKTGERKLRTRPMKVCETLPPVSVSLSGARAASSARVFAAAGHAAPRRAGGGRGGRGAPPVLLFTPGAAVVLAVRRAAAHVCSGPGSKQERKMQRLR